MIYRANVDGTNREDVVLYNYKKGVSNMAVAQTPRILFLSSGQAYKITSVSIEEGSSVPKTEVDFLTNLIHTPAAILVDDEQGYLYIALRWSIVRTNLTGSGHRDVVFKDGKSLNINRMGIDLTRYVRRIFFFDLGTHKSFFKDLNSFDISSAQELTEYIPLPNLEKIRDICYFNSVIYWIIGGSSGGIGKMTDYDQTNPSFQFQEISQFNPRRAYFADIEA
ncbi:uncharacterized protein LOC115920740 [Strongylocentrotus purpuratus]|uniref:Uncharacterized protein n=1 Tax=Strongylocentrotus purpuratus TaxID=7668 RepID=A0A7M7SUV5_STRPU|nr:uncharacterized protein LOC115920740 [Strongylocentrotus purpuratus]